MNKSYINKKLIENGILSASKISEDEYNAGVKVNPNLYFKEERYREYSGSEVIFYKIENNDLSSEDIRLLLQLERNNNIESIKHILQGFIAINIIGLIIILIASLV